jgi:signal transduction histidine kinase
VCPSPPSEVERSPGAEPWVGPSADHPLRDALRELNVVREIARALHAADRPEELYRFALARVCPLLGAAFASVYVVDGSSDLMRLAAAHDWPERFAQWLGEARVRLGAGPSGEAAAERRVVEVPDVLADETLADWREVSDELGIRAIIALPLLTGGAGATRRHVLGAVAFYFKDPSAFSDAQRALLRLVADQLSDAAEKAELIDELRRANAALVESNAELERQYVAVLDARRVKDEFLANVSHELRTPLAAVMGYVGLLLDDISGPLTEAQRRDLTQVQVASDRLLDLIDNLLELTTLKNGGLEVQVDEFDPRTPVQEALSRVTTRPPTVALRVEEPTTVLPMARTDRKKIVKILVSLLTNAFKFTASGEVRVIVEVRGGRVSYRVQDTGIGIPADAQRMVFDEFRQVDGSAARRYGGSGLGLTLARRLARLLGGDIELESAVGVGSAFTVELPLEYAAPVDPHVSQPTPAYGTPAVRTPVLLVR